jgi:ankyrin repeat protein
MKLFNENKMALYSEMAAAVYQQVREDLPIHGILQVADQTQPQLLRTLDKDNSSDFEAVIQAYYNAWIFWVSTSLNTQDEIIASFNNEPSSPREEKKNIVQPHKDPAFVQVIKSNLTQDLASALRSKMPGELNADIKPYILRTLKDATSFDQVYRFISQGPEVSRRIFGIAESPAMGGIVSNPTAAFQRACAIYREAVYRYLLNFLEQNKLSQDERFSRSFELILHYLIDKYPHEILKEFMDEQGPINLRFISTIIEKLGTEGLVKPMDARGYTPFHAICQIKGTSEQVKCMFELLGAEAKDLAQPADWKPFSLTQLLWGRIQQLQKVDLSDGVEVINEIRQCIEAGAELTSFDNASQKTALHYAAETGHVQVVSLLLETCREAGIDWASFTTAAGSPLHTAMIPKYDKVTEAQRLEVARLLLEQGFQVDEVDRHYTRNTALHYAVKQGYKQVTELFLDEYAADSDRQNSLGNTPLHLALENKKPEDRDNLVACVTLLLEKGADPDIANHEKETPRTLASKSKDLRHFAKQFVNISHEQQLEKKLKQLPKLRLELAKKNQEIACLKWELNAKILNERNLSPNLFQASNPNVITREPQHNLHKVADVRISPVPSKHNSSSDSLNLEGSELGVATSPLFPSSRPLIEQANCLAPAKHEMEERSQAALARSNIRFFPVQLSKSTAISGTATYDSAQQVAFFSRAEIVLQEEEKVKVSFKDRRLANSFQQYLVDKGFYHSTQPNALREIEHKEINNNNDQDQYSITLTSAEYNMIRDNDQAYEELIASQVASSLRKTKI